MIDSSRGWTTVLDAVRRHQDAGLDQAARQAALVSSLRLATMTIAGTRACSVTQIQPDGRYATPVSDGPLAIELDEAQYEAGDGPCLTAARNKQQQQVDRFWDDPRWPGFRTVAQEKGVASSLSIPLVLQARPGAVNFYGSAPELYAASRAQAVADLIARISQGLMTVPGDVSSSTADDRRHQTDVDRAVIAHAQGLIMRRYEVTSEVAYRRLAMRSANENQHLVDAARQVIASFPHHAAED